MLHVRVDDDEWRLQMKCPIDETPLVMSDRNGIEIDYCPKCRGVWLDRGELDKIIERATPTVAPVPMQEPGRPKVEDAGRDASRRPGGSDARPYGDDRRGGYDDDDQYRPQKRRKSILGDIFDF